MAWTDVIAYLAATTLLFFGFLFIPRNVRRYFVQRPGIIGWSRRRVFHAASWIVIVGGYLLAGFGLLQSGWHSRLAGYSFATAMLGFIPVPCHWPIFNTSRFWRIARNIFFVLVGIGSILITR